MSYPSGYDLQAYMLSAGMIPGNGSADALPFAPAMKSVIAKWERDTGWAPFLAETTTRTYREWTRSALDLGGSFLTITSVVYDDGAAAVLHEDYEVKPDNGQNILWLRLWTLPRCKVAVTGSFGYTADCPVDVREALLSQAASDLGSRSGSVAGTISGPISEIDQDEVSIKYALSTSGPDSHLNAVQRAMTQSYREAVARYRRQVVV